MGFMSPARMDKIEAGLRLAVTYIESFNNHDSKRMAACLEDGCVYESCMPGPEEKAYTGKDSIREYFERLFAGNPMARIKVEETFGFGARCIVLWVFQPGPESAAQDQVRGIEVIETRNNLIVKELSYRKGA